MEITDSTIEHLANLSAFDIPKEDYPNFKKELKKMTEFISQIDNADIPVNIEYDNIISIEDLREDICAESFSNEEVLLNAPKKAKGAFSVPLMMD